MVAYIASETLTHSEIVPEMNKGQISGTFSPSGLPLDKPAKLERFGTQPKKMLKTRTRNMGMTTTKRKLLLLQAVDD